MEKHSTRRAAALGQKLDALRFDIDWVRVADEAHLDLKQAQEWIGHSDPATTLRRYVRLTAAERAKAVAGLDEVTRAALERAEERALEDAQPASPNVIELASRRR
jgi:hypothetical protein